MSLVDRVDHWRQILAPEWRISVYIEPLDGLQAQMQTDEDYHHGCIRFDPEYVQGAGDDDLDVTVVHEILHLLTRESRRTFDMLDGLVAESTLDMLCGRHVSEEEKLVDRLSRVIAGQIPYGTSQL